MGRGGGGAAAAACDEKPFSTMPPTRREASWPLNPSGEVVKVGFFWLLLLTSFSDILSDDFSDRFKEEREGGFRSKQEGVRRG